MYSPQVLLREFALRISAQSLFGSCNAKHSSGRAARIIVFAFGSLLLAAQPALSAAKKPAAPAAKTKATPAPASKAADTTKAPATASAVKTPPAPAASGTTDAAASADAGAKPAPSAAPAAPGACAASFGVFAPIGPLPASSVPSPAANFPVQRTVHAAPAADGKTPAMPAPPPGKAASAALVKVIQLRPGLNASDVAAALKDKIAGVTSLDAIGPSHLLLSIDPSKAPKNAAKPVSAEDVEKELEELIQELPAVSVTPEVVNLPEGTTGACAIIGAIGHQLSGVASLAAFGDSRILVGFTGSQTEVETARSNLKKLIDGLAVSSVSEVHSVAMRLYYDRDADSVAKAVQAAFAQLKVSPISMNPANTYKDTIVLADPSESASATTLDQARRMIAQLDEPRAQMIVNAWSLQLSSDRQQNTSELVPQARRLASSYNDALESAVMLGWNYVNQANADLQFDPLFSEYLCDFFTYGSGSDAASRMKTSGTGRCATIEAQRSPEGGPHYALGYGALFDADAPDLIQMTILAMATTNPGKTIEATLDKMEGGDLPLFQNFHLHHPMTAGRENDSCQDEDRLFYESQWKLIKPVYVENGGLNFYNRLQNETAPPYVGFACTRAVLEEMTAHSGAGMKYSTSAVGQFRAAVANYLFQNKMMAEYPNDFEPFLYPQSAATLDAVLTPIVEAFNQDLEALQQHLQYELTKGVPQDKHLHYTSNGLVSVKVVSGNQAMVQTQSLNYFPQNPTMKLEDFAKALAAGETSSSTTPLLAGTLSSVVSAIGAYSAAKPAQVTAKVGGGLATTVTPYTLSSARGAELNVNVTYNENAAATISSDTTQSQASDDLNSRVSEHEVSTLVRMDSLKFFEISTMQSVIARQKARYKLIDPVVELPILDTLAFGPRRKPEVIYNQSIIFMEASIMPTAADLGQGIAFVPDRIEKGACKETEKQYLRAHSFRDFCNEDGANELYRIMDYHKGMVAYFAGQFIGSDGSVQPPANIPIPALQ